MKQRHTTTEVASALGCHPSTVRSARKKLNIGTFLGGAWFFEDDDVSALRVRGIGTKSRMRSSGTLGTSEVAKFLGTSRQNVARIAAAHEIGIKNEYGIWEFTKDDVTAIDAAMVGPGRPPGR